MEVGKILKETRESLGLTLDEVEEATKIRRKYIKAMEEEQFDVLPGPVYTRAFLRSYARFLKLNADEILDKCPSHITESAPQVGLEEHSKPVVENVKKEFDWPKRYLIPAVAALVFFLVVFWGLSSKVWNKFSQRPVNEMTEQAPITQVQQPLIQEQQAKPGVNLVLNVKDNRCWMRVVVDGSDVFQGEVTAGQSKSFEAKEKISVTLGNAGVVEVYLNGQNIGFLGEKGEVVIKEFALPIRG